MSKKRLTAYGLLLYLQRLQEKNINLKEILVNYREDRDSDVMPVEAVEEDLYAPDANNILESIVLITDTSEK